MLNDLNWQPLQIRRKNKRLIVFHKAVNQNSPVEIPDYVTQSTYSGTRSHSNAFIEIRANYEQYKNSFLPRTIKDWKGHGIKSLAEIKYQPIDGLSHIKPS
jgi:hypothetical protein